MELAVPPALKSSGWLPNPESDMLLYEQESNELMRIALQLHRELGPGFKEKVYQDAMEVLLNENGIPYEREKRISLRYHGVELEHDFFYDFLVWDKIGVELKAYSEITGEFQSQIINYLHISNHELGVIFNFGAKSLGYKWFPNTTNIRQTADID